MRARADTLQADLTALTAGKVKGPQVKVEAPKVDVKEPEVKLPRAGLAAGIGLIGLAG